jgi:hypothetical protein
MKRHKDAIIISDGACNPKAIINAMARAVEELSGADTPTVCADPALKLMLHQLAFLMGIPTSERHTEWCEWVEFCEGQS